MIGRQAALLCRIPVRSRFSRLLLQQPKNSLTPRVAVVIPLRNYATPGRPKKAVGEPSRTVKRAVKRAAASIGSGDSTAELKLKAKKKTAAAKKTTPKKKTPKKEPTEKQQAAKRVRDERATIKTWKTMALEPPKNHAQNAYMVYFAERSKQTSSEHSIKGQSQAGARSEMANRMRDISGEWKSLTSADVEHYNHLARTTNQAKQAEYKRWVESHTPDQIQEANSARRQLRRKYPTAKGKAAKWPAIHDERAVKLPLSAYQQFVSNRLNSGDFKNIPPVERMKLIAQEWNALNVSEKEKYKNLHAQDYDRYVSEYSSVHGHAPTTNGLHTQQAAAAA